MALNSDDNGIVTPATSWLYCTYIYVDVYLYIYIHIYLNGVSSKEGTVRMSNQQHVFC